MIARKHRWETHILDRHPELEGWYDPVELTIREPALVTHDATYDNGENFYRRLTDPEPYRGRYLKVCVAYEPGDVDETVAMGRVVTAYVTRNVGKGERRRWP